MCIIQNTDDKFSQHKQMYQTWLKRLSPWGCFRNLTAETGLAAGLQTEHNLKLECRRSNGSNNPVVYRLVYLLLILCWVIMLSQMTDVNYYFFFTGLWSITFQTSQIWRQPSFKPLNSFQNAMENMCDMQQIFVSFLSFVRSSKPVTGWHRGLWDRVLIGRSLVQVRNNSQSAVEMCTCSIWSWGGKDGQV